MVWGRYKRIKSSVYIIITSKRRDIHNVKYRGEGVYFGAAVKKILIIMQIPTFMVGNLALLPLYISIV